MPKLHPQPATTDSHPAYEQLLDSRNIPANTKPHYLRGAKAWIATHFLESGIDL
jgi:site-specific recombinase XerD